MPNKQPDEYTKCVMFREATRVVLGIIMNNHVYTFDNEIRKQVRGSPIGLQLTGVLAQIFMIWWDKEFAARLKEFGIGKKLNERYVDINVATQATPLGMRYKDGKMFVDDQLVREDTAMSADERTMMIVKEIGDDIHPSIRLDVDYPSKHQDNKIPILDMKVWVETREREHNGEVKRVAVILHEYYGKSIASKPVVNARSVLPRTVQPRTVQRTVLTQEVLSTE